MPVMAVPMSPAARKLNNLLGQTSAQKPNILILVFDTFSAEHASLYGYPRETTPNLARFAEQAHVYHHHYAGGNFTSAGTSSLLTGTYPWTHRNLQLFGTVAPELAAHNLFQAFDESYYKIAYTHNPLVSILLDQFRGAIDQWKPIRDLCLVDFRFSDILFPNDFTPALVSEHQTRQDGLDMAGSLFLSMADLLQTTIVKKFITRRYGARFPRGLPLRPFSFLFLLEDVMDWLLAELPRLPQPFLAYVHVLPPHSPYTTRIEFDGLFAGDGLPFLDKPENFTSLGRSRDNLEGMRLLYNEYIPYADAEFGRFFAALQGSPLLDNTILAVTSDHGELFERGIFGHITKALYQDITHIPLLIRKPGQTQRLDFDQATSCVDVLPTLLTAAGQEIPAWCEGSVLPGFPGAAADPKRPVFTVEGKSNAKMAPLTKATLSMVKGDYKLIHYLGYEGMGEKLELYNLAEDPQELNNLSHKDTETARKMQEEMDATLAQYDRQ